MLSLTRHLDRNFAAASDTMQTDRRPLSADETRPLLCELLKQRTHQQRRPLFVLPSSIA